MSQSNPSLSMQLLNAVQVPVDNNTRDRAATLLLDWLGCIAAAANSPVADSLSVHAAKHYSDVGRCFTACAGPLAVQEAAFVNGALGNVLEMDDVHRNSIMHVGDVVMPAALAVAQQRSSSSQVFLDSIVKAYEVAIRLGSVAASGGYSAWYNSGTCGVFGATVAAGLQLNLSDAEMADAMGQAGMLASGIWQCRLEVTFSKQLATAHAAQMGVLASQLANTGFPGASQILEGPLGFFPTYYSAANIDELDTSPVTDWSIHTVSIKPWPACRHTHPAIEAALQLRTSLAGQWPDVVRVATYGAALDFCDNPSPVSDHEARFSLQHCVAVALVRGQPSIEDFQESARRDPSIVRLSGMVELVKDPCRDALFPRQMSAEVTIMLGEEPVLHAAVESALGDPENPVSNKALKQKFCNNLEYAGHSPDLANALIDAIESLPESTSINRLSTALDALMK